MYGKGTAVESFEAKKVLIAVYDDTTIFMAMSFMTECEKLGIEPTVAMIRCREEVYRKDGDRFAPATEYRVQVSDRQLAGIRARAEDFIYVNEDNFSLVCALYDVVLVTKLPYLATRSFYRRKLFRETRKCVIVAFSSGLDATPASTIGNRAFADILMANSPNHLEAIAATPPASYSRAPELGVGHPFFARRAACGWKSWDQIRTVYFLHQSVWPSNPVTRRELFAYIADLAIAHPDKQFVLKLRHKKGENEKNINKERYSPEGFFADVRLANLSLDASPFPETLERADMYISLSSSGIVEGIVNGTMGLFVEGFGGEEQDPISRRIIGQFRSAGMVVHKDALLAGELPAVDSARLEGHLCDADYFPRMLEQCARHAASPGAPVNRRAVNDLPLYRRARRYARRVKRNLVGYLAKT